MHLSSLQQRKCFDYSHSVLWSGSEGEDAWNEGNMWEKPPAVQHVKGHFSWVLPQGMWLIGLDWRAVAHKCASHLYSLIKVLQCTKMLIQDSSSLLWLLYKTNYLNTESLSISYCSSDYASQMWFSLCYSPQCRQKAFSGWDPATHVII